MNAQTTARKAGRKGRKTQAWQIVSADGKSALSMTYAYADTDPALVLASWKKHMNSLGYSTPDGAQAFHYHTSALDMYGVGRGG